MSSPTYPSRSEDVQLRELADPLIPAVAASTCSDDARAFRVGDRQSLGQAQQDRELPGMPPHSGQGLFEPMQRMQAKRLEEMVLLEELVKNEGCRCTTTSSQHPCSRESRLTDVEPFCRAACDFINVSPMLRAFLAPPRRDDLHGAMTAGHCAIRQPSSRKTLHHLETKS